MFPIFKSGPGVFKLTKAVNVVEPDGSVVEQSVEDKFNFSSHPVVLLLTARALLVSDLGKALFSILGFFHLSKIRDALLVIAKSGLLNGVKARSLGRLSVKEEAAGKVRVFAMVDAWTQWSLRPLHDTLFEILKGIPTDGTFDQGFPIARADGFPGLWSLDLTAATDRLPIWLQVQLIAALLGNQEIALAWAKLLVGRGYYFSSLMYPAYAGTYDYTVGQPMGALSSWAMLAFTHHFLVQCSFWLAGGSKLQLYQNYAVLGDDLVIGDYHVKVMYLKICKSLGVQVGLHKSLLSPKGLCLEFAKRTVWVGQDVSPVPLRELVAASETLPGFVEFVRKYKLSLPQSLRAFGFGWRNLSWLDKPLGKLSGNIRLIILGLSVPADADAVEDFFALGQSRLIRYSYEVGQLVRLFSSTEVNRLRRQISSLKLALVKTVPVSWSGESVAVLQKLEKLSLLSALKRAKDDGITGVPVFLQNRMQTYGLTDWNSVWGLFFNWIDDMWSKRKNSLYMQLDKIEGLLPHPIDDAFLFYWRYTRVLREFSLVNLAPFSKVKVLPSANTRGLPPLQIRLWRKWSGVIQGSQPLDSIKR